MALHGLHSPLFLMAASSSASLEQGKLRAECTGRRDAGDDWAGTDSRLNSAYPIPAFPINKLDLLYAPEYDRPLSLRELFARKSR